MRRVLCLMLSALVAVGLSGCDQPAQEATAPVVSPTVETLSPTQQPATEFDAETLKLLKKQRANLRETQQLRQQLQRELDVIRVQLDSSNRELQEKQQAVDRLVSEQGE